MNDKELDKSIKKSFENFIKELATNPEKVFDNNDLQIKYNNVLKEKIKLQSNWNSLREELKKHKDILNARWQQFASHRNQNKDILNRFESKIEEIDFILDKMNELEGKDKK